MAAALATVFFAGCSDDQSDFPNQSDTPQGTNAPASLSGRSYSFTVTSSQSFPEDFNSGYVIDFETPTTYTLHPAPQANRQPPDQQGNYTYDRRSGLVHLISITPVNGRLIQMVMTFTSPTSGAAHLTGPNGETQDVVFIQSLP
jgi:hypothetical protein